MDHSIHRKAAKSYPRIKGRSHCAKKPWNASTWPVQIRRMLIEKHSLYVICPGRTFKVDELDTPDSPVLHQVDGLVVDRGITMTHLKGTLDNFTRYMFGYEVRR